MLIKDLQGGSIHKYGSSSHDSLAISQDGRTLSYYNLQCGDGSAYGDYRFVMDDGEIPAASKTPDALHCECYFNIGGFKGEACEKGYLDALKDFRALANQCLVEIREYDDFVLYDAEIDRIIENLKVGAENVD